MQNNNRNHVEFSFLVGRRLSLDLRREYEIVKMNDLLRDNCQ